MSIESSSLYARARIHAALGDPARLAIVDMLRLGDLSPGEIGTLLSLPSNLVAHHVKVLQQEGIVVRMRSEGDRRRTYLRVALPPDPAVPPQLKAKRVLFVCTRNSARSQLAAALWAKSNPLATLSAGTNPAPSVHRLTIEAAARHGLALAKEGTRSVDSVACEGDLIVAVCDNAHERLPGNTQNRLHWSVPDPVPLATSKAFDATIADLTARIGHLSTALHSRHADARSYR